MSAPPKWVSSAQNVSLALFLARLLPCHGCGRTGMDKDNPYSLHAMDHQKTRGGPCTCTCSCFLWLLAFLSCPFFLSFDRPSRLKSRAAGGLFPFPFFFLSFSPPFFFSRLPLERGKREEAANKVEGNSYSLTIVLQKFFFKKHIYVIRQLSDSLTRCTSGFAFKVNFSYYWRQCFQEVHLQTARTRNV